MLGELFFPFFPCFLLTLIILLPVFYLRLIFWLIGAPALVEHECIRRRYRPPDAEDSDLCVHLIAGLRVYLSA